MKKMKFNYWIRISTLVLMVSFTSCQTQKGWVYKPNHWKPTEKAQQQITISTFEDDRINENKNVLMMYMCPLSPFGWQNLSTPELYPVHLNSGTWLNYNPKVDFAKALAKELKEGSKFKDVQYVESPIESGYYIEGRIINTTYRAKIFSYGLSYFGPILWWIGLPAGTFSNDLAIELTCNAPGSKVLLKKTYKVNRYKKTTWIYNLKSDFEYATLLKKIYSDFINDLNRSIK